jgi:GcrA cell cycle regulator
MCWTDELVKLLKELYEEGYSRSQIGQRVGKTRNAVIGKLHRMGIHDLPRERKKPVQRVPGNVDNARRSKHARVHTNNIKRRHAIAAIVAALDPEADDASKPFGTPVSLADLSTKNCHWPLGDPMQDGFCFCGAQAVTGLPYCASHTRIAYETPTERRARRKDFIIQQGTR